MKTEQYRLQIPHRDIQRKNSSNNIDIGCIARNLNKMIVLLLQVNKIHFVDP